jgi:hypothetical protein
VQWKGRDKFVAIFDRYLGVARNTDGTLPGYFTNGENPEGAAQQLGWFALSTCYEMRTCPKSLMAKFANMSVGFGARVESLAVGGGEGLGVGLGRLGGSGGAAGEGVGGPCSFSPDTQVLLKDGKSKPIGKIKVGDKVQAANPKTGKHQGSRTVQHVWINHDHDLLDLSIRTKNGHTATLHTTTNHPFWDDTTHTWVPAGKLHHGDALNTATNGHAYVVATHPTPGAANRWNLTVQHLHTYYVLAGQTPVLVHNSAGCLPALRDWSSQRYQFGNQTFLLDKKGMEHILTRHHPNYWDGSVKSTQSFFDPGMSIDDVQDAIGQVMRQNRDTLLQRGSQGMYQIRGNVNGVDYVLGMNRGRVGQFYPESP